ncbi:MAG: hypothetical protein IT492_21660 [Gammaproteobacteria bacterium]|mgnify:CR=1 FL=1|nr:hypothetical protein [Gammaproteobacteria bacterium]
MSAHVRSLTVALVCALALAGCSEDQQNKLSRVGVSWLDGDYRVTYASGEHVKSWEVHDGKVTSDPQKGYYFFWAEVAGKKSYVQTPIGHTYVEELP